MILEICFDMSRFKHINIVMFVTFINIIIFVVFNFNKTWPVSTFS
jgi:hypothetical protein